MKKTTVLFGLSAAVAVAALVGVIVLACVWVGYGNREKSLRIAFDNEQRANGADFDNMVKTIAQKYEVKGDFETTLKDVTREAVAGRSGGSLAKMVSESYPDLEPGIYREMMATIEGKRNQFQQRQLRLSDIKAEHDNLIARFPGSLFLAGARPLDIKLVTSARTDAAFATGQDNDVALKRK